MALSNTAVPRYYGKFREAVIRGEIPVCKEISMEMNRIDDLIANPGIYYDDKAVEGWIKYCEAEMTLTDGSDLHLLDSFKLWGEQVFGWYYFVERTVYEPNADGRGGHYVKKMIKKRLVNKQYLIVGRGAAKSIYDSCIQSFFENVDTSTTHQITTAPTMKLAEEVMSPIRTAITRARGPVFQFLTQGSLQNTTGSQANRVKLASTKKGIENFLTGSLIEIRPMSINKLQGLRCKIATVDEWLSGDIREDVIGAIEQGASKVDDYLIVATSSEGTVRNGAGDTIKMELMSILKGDYPNPHVSIWWYKLDSVDEVGYPEMWMKANPNIGKTVSYETYQLDVERAEKAPAARNDILAKRFGLPMEGYTYYFTYEETLPHRKRDYWQKKFVFSSMFSSSKLNERGQTVQELPPLDEITDNTNRDLLHKHMVHHVAEQRGFIGSIILRFAFGFFQSIGVFSEDDLGFLVYDNVIIPDGRAEIIKEGLYLGLSGKLYAAMHILLPQTENIFRNLVKMCGDTVTFLKEDGTEEYKPLSQLFKSEQLCECYSEDIIFTFQSIMDEPIGENLRNLNAHGVLEPQKGNSEVALCFLCLLIKLLSMYI